MNFKWWLKYMIKVLLTPSCWIRIHPTSKAWDLCFIELLKNHKFHAPVRHNHEPFICTVCLGPNVLWVGHSPANSFQPWKPVELSVLPRRKTVLYAMDRLEQDLLTATKGN